MEPSGSSGAVVLVMSSSILHSKPDGEAGKLSWSAGLLLMAKPTSWVGRSSFVAVRSENSRSVQDSRQY
jgi:hypothetical protein